MIYEINVAVRTKQGGYTHLFATHERSLTTSKKALEVYHLLAKKFPAPEYHISISRKSVSSRELSVEDLGHE